MNRHGASFGIRAPAFPAGTGPELLCTFAERAERLGLASFWLPDRLIPVGGYLAFAATDPLVEPLTGLAYVAARTSRIRLGTGVIIAPLRHPLVLAKAAATVHHLSGGRLVVGIGTGWAAEEFAAVDVPRAERGTRTDEVVDVLRAAFTGEVFEHCGRHHAFGPVRVDPSDQPPPAIWGSGGGGPPEFGLATAGALSPTVARRLARLDGWLTRPTATVDQIVGERREVARQAEAIGRDPEAVEVAHVNFAHLVEGGRGAALDAQRPTFAELLGEQLSFERVQELHWTGTLADVAERVERLLEAGVRHVVFHPLRPDPEQVDLWVHGVLDRVGVKHNPEVADLSPGEDRLPTVPIDPSGR